MAASLLCVLLAGCSGQNGSDDSARAERTPEQRLRSYLSTKAEELELPSVGVAVMRDGRVDDAVSIGRADVAASLDAHENTLYEAPYVTGLVTAVAAMRMVERGELSLDSRAEGALPNLPPAYRSLSLRDLLLGSAGIVPMDSLEPLNVRGDFTFPEAIATLAKTQPMFRPGSRPGTWSAELYVLAHWIEATANRPFEDVVLEEVIRPAGLAQTTFLRADEAPGELAAGYFLMNGDLFTLPPSLPMATRGWAGLVSSPTDLARLGDALLSGKLVKPETLRLMSTPLRLADGTETARGLGLSVRRIGDVTVLEAGGGVSGHSASVFMVPDTGLSIGLATNLYPIELFPIARRVAQIYDDRLVPEALEPTEDPQPERTARLRSAVTALDKGQTLPEAMSPELIASAKQRSGQPLLPISEPLGSILAFEFLKEEQAHGANVVFARVTTANGSWVFAMTLDSEDRLAGLTATKDEPNP